MYEPFIHALRKNRHDTASRRLAATTRGHCLEVELLLGAFPSLVALRTTPEQIGSRFCSERKLPLFLASLERQGEVDPQTQVRPSPVGDGPGGFALTLFSHNPRKREERRTIL